ncbi:MAG: ATP-binding protein, partial [Jiangellaceae bacterium]|nr:ATP-binding protein [Jiangellaceae bacterium]
MTRADLDTPFVGRERELSALLDAVERAALSQPTAVLVAGDAGVGKTRLLTELAAKATVTGATVLLGHCLDIGDVGLPYLAFTEALRPLRADATAQGGQTTREARLEFAGSFAPGSDASQLQLFDSVAATLGRASRQGRGPVVLILEDLHWADQSTRDLLAFLVGRMRDERLLIVASYRSDDLHRRHPLRPLLARLARLPVVERYELRPFDAAEMGRYLAALYGS